MRLRLIKLCPVLILCGWLAWQGALPARGESVSGRVVLVPSSGHPRVSDNSSAVVWLTPLDETRLPPPSSQRPPTTRRYKLIQKNKRFTPHLLVVPAGATVEFPNQDPIFHNVFSLFDGRRFDLGLYEAGSTRAVTFNEPGVSYIFCNIHPEMSAVVIALATPYYAVSDAAGEFTILSVPAGRYQLNLWHERALPETLKAVSRSVAVSTSATSLGELRVPEAGDLLAKHKNKYGRDYDSAQPLNKTYEQP